MRRKPGQRQLRAIVYGPVEDQDRWEPSCVMFCERRGYEVVALVVGGLEKWPAILEALAAGVGDLVVVDSSTHLDPRRLPRIESVTQELPRTPARRRTGRVSRWRS